MTSEILTKKELMELQVKKSLEDALEIYLLNESVSEWIEFSLKKDDFLHFAEKLDWNWEKLFSCIYYEINQEYPDRLPIFKHFWKDLNFDTEDFLVTYESKTLFDYDVLKWTVEIDPYIPSYADVY